MKFFTRDRYEMEQVEGWLNMDSETFDNLEMQLIENKVDINTFFSSTNELLRRHLPDNLKGKIKNIRDAVHLSYCDKSRSDTAAELEMWHLDLSRERLENDKVYRSYLALNMNLFNMDVQEFLKHSFHDANILTINKPTHDTVVFQLDCEACCPPQSIVIITFDKVKSFSISDYAFPKWWLYEEIELINENHFTLGVLFEQGECELTAERVSLSFVEK